MEFFQFNHVTGQGYYGYRSAEETRRRSCIIIEDSPGVYRKWLPEVADCYNLALAVVLPFSDESMALLCGENASFGLEKLALTIPDLSQCLVILDMRNDPESGQTFTGYVEEQATFAGLHFWERVPDLSGIKFLIASRFEESTFEEEGLTVGFVQINKAEDAESSLLPKDTCDQLNKKVKRIFEKAARHGKSKIIKSGNGYDFHHFGEILTGLTGKPIERLAAVLSERKVSCIELIGEGVEVFGTGGRKNGTLAEGLRDSDGRLHSGDEESAAIGKMTPEERSKWECVYRTAQAECHRLKEVIRLRQIELEEMEQSQQRELRKLQKRYEVCIIEAEAHFQEKYGVPFRKYSSLFEDTVEPMYLSEEERLAFGREIDHYMGIKEELEAGVRELERKNENVVNPLREEIAALKLQYKTIGKQRDEAYRISIGNDGEVKSSTPSSKAEENCRKTFLGKDAEKRGIYHKLSHASDSFKDYLRRHISMSDGHVLYTGEIEWIFEHK